MENRDSRQDGSNKGLKVTRSDFDRFFRENYCPLEYELVRRDMEEIYEADPEGFFAEGTDPEKLTEDNFILFMSGEAYSAMEETVEESCDALNQEIMDAMLQISAADRQADLVTRTYWDNNHELLNEFLGRLFREKIRKKKSGEDYAL